MGKIARDNRSLAFNTSDKFLFLNLDNQIFSLKVSRYLEGNIEIGNCLGPFVWESSLLFCFFCAGCSFFSGSEFCDPLLILKVYEYLNPGDILRLAHRGVTSAS